METCVIETEVKAGADLMSDAEIKKPVIYWRCRTDPIFGLSFLSVYFHDLNQHDLIPEFAHHHYDILLNIADGRSPADYNAYSTKVKALEAFKKRMLLDIDRVRGEIGAGPVNPKSYGNRDFIAVSAVRYALGRMSYIVSDTVGWLMAQRDNIGRDGWTVIKRDIEEAFKRDDEDRADGRDCKALGMDIDRQQWERVRALWKPVTQADHGSAEE